MQYTHLKGDIQKISKVLHRREEQVSSLGFVVHMSKDDKIVLSKDKVSIADIKVLIGLIGARLGEWAIIQHWNYCEPYELQMKNKYIVYEDVLKGV